MRLRIRTIKLFLVLALLLVVGPVTYAWISYSLTQSLSVTASIHKSYFESGNGSEQDPFEIKYPIQLYYFTWLQNLGYFNNVNGKTGVTQYYPTYFYVSEDLDMTGFILPPAGTTTYPFIGHFDGEDHVIANLSVKSSSTNTDLTDVPNDGNVKASTDPQILGFFGVIGDYNGVGTYSSFTPTISDFTLCDATIDAHTPDDDKTLIGVLAGYVNGEISNVSIVSNSTGNKLTINNGIDAFSSPTTNYSDYGVVGFCEEDYRGALNLTNTTLSEPLKITNYSGGSGFGAGSGFGNEFGNSIPMKDIYNRLLTVYSEYAHSSGDHTVREITYLDSNDNIISTETVAVTQAGHFSNYSNDDYSYTFNKHYTGMIDFMFLYGDLNADISRATQTTEHISKKQKTVSGQEYKIKYEDAADGYYIYVTINGTTHYLSNAANRVADVTDKDQATVWTRIASSYSGAYHYSTVYNNTTYYLQLNATTLTTLSTNMSGYAGTFLRTDNNGNIYRSSKDGSGTKNYLYYNNGWKITTSSGIANKGRFLQSDPITYYLKMDNFGNLSTVTELSQGTNWLYSNNKIFTLLNNNIYYLTATSSSISVSNAILYANVKDFTYSAGNGISFTDGGTYYVSIKGSVSVASSKITTELVASSVLPATSAWETTYIGPTTTKTSGQNGFPCTYFPLSVNENNIFSTNNNNTGYIISGKSSAPTNHATSSTPSPSDPEDEYYNSGDIRVSVYPKLGNILDENIYTITGNGSSLTKTNITSNHSGYAKYEEVFENFSLESNIYGLHFMDASISSGDNVTITNSIVNGAVATRIMPKNCIDFTVSANENEQGYITFVAGTYFQDNTVFFSLHKVDRSNGLTTTEIKKIYMNNDDETLVYVMDGQTDNYSNNNNYTLKFNSNWLTAPGGAFSDNSIYYFEIPVDNGEYALGSTSGNGAYLMYLDIGSSGSENEVVDGAKTIEYLKTTTYSYVYPDGVTLEIDSTQVDSPITTVGSNKNIETIITTGFSYTVWEWQKETFVGTIGAVTYTEQSPLILVRVVKTPYYSNGTPSAATSTTVYEKKGSAEWVTNPQRTTFDFLDRTDVNIASYVGGATTYYYFGSPSYALSITPSTSSSIFTDNPYGIDYNIISVTGNLHTMMSGETYSVTLQTSSTLYKIEDASGYTSSNVNSVITLEKE